MGQLSRTAPRAVQSDGNDEQQAPPGQLNATNGKPHGQFNMTVTFPCSLVVSFHDSEVTLLTPS